MTKKRATSRATARADAPGATERAKYFTASWCPPSQLVHRMLAKHPDLAPRLEILDVDGHGANADRYDIESIPTFVHPDGRRRGGTRTARELPAFLDDDPPHGARTSNRSLLPNERSATIDLRPQKRAHQYAVPTIDRPRRLRRLPVSGSASVLPPFNAESD